MKRTLTYLIGVMALGLVYEWLKNQLGDIVFVAVAVVYLITLRFLANKFGSDRGNKMVNDN